MFIFIIRNLKINLMNGLEGENKLLKDYIATLEKQNQARNQERNTIIQQIDRLAAQNDRLNQLLSNNQTRTLTTVISNNPTLQHELSNLKQAMINKVKLIDSLNLKINSHNSQLMIKQNQLSKLKAEYAGLLAQNKRIKDAQAKNSTQGNMILILQNQVNSYKVKISQMESIQNQLRSTNIKSIDLENSKKKMESDYKILEAENRRLSQQNRKLQMTNRQHTKIENDYRTLQADNRRLKDQIRRLQASNRQLKNNSNLVSSESVTFTSAKLALEATIRQLNSKIQWQQNQNKSVQQQKSMIERRLKDVERQLQESKSRLIQLRHVEESFKSVQSGISIKQKQMQALQQMIHSLKENKKFLEKSLKEKEDIIVTLQSQIYTYKSSSFNNDHYLRQLNSLKIQKLQIEKQSYHLKSHCEMLQIQINKVKQKEDSFANQLSSMRQQREQLLKQRDIYLHNLQQKDRQISILKQRLIEFQSYKWINHQKVQVDRQTYGPDRHSKLQNSSELKLLVEKLREQMEEMKSSYHFKSNFHQEHHEHKHSMSPNHNISMINLHKGSKSPSKGNHSKIVINNERSRVDINKQKWQNLQRKINALRNQNEYLKKSLFD